MRHILEHFQIRGVVTSIELFGSGHIHTTYEVVTTKAHYLLQKINDSVFNEVAAMMLNIYKVTNYLSVSFPKLGYDNQETLRLVETLKGQYFVQVTEGYFRMFDFKSNLKSFDIPTSDDQVFEGAKSYGYFLKALGEFEPAELAITIPDFHNLAHRLDQFNLALSKLKHVPSHEAAHEMKMVNELADRLLPIWYLHSQEKVPIRVTHNDTKFNNVLLDGSNRGRCVIDLDTVMPGIVHYDFGDGIRSTASTAKEDESYLQLVNLDRERYHAFKAGYMEGAADILKDEEKAFLSLSGAYMAFIMGLRFLTDFISGNIYYRIDYPHHNLDRCRNQFRLTHEILAQRKDLK